MSRYVLHLTHAPGSVPCRVIAKLQPRVWRVILGVGMGQADFGIHTDWPDAELPPELRRPNAEFFVSLEDWPPPGL